MGYRFTPPTFTLGASWRALSLDREDTGDDEYFKYDIVQDGLGIGANFSPT